MSQEQKPKVFKFCPCCGAATDAEYFADGLTLLTNCKACGWGRVEHCESGTNLPQEKPKARQAPGLND